MTQGNGGRGEGHVRRRMSPRGVGWSEGSTGSTGSSKTDADWLALVGGGVGGAGLWRIWDLHLKAWGTAWS